MHHQTEFTGVRRYLCGLLATCTLSASVGAGAQTWPDPPEVNGAYTANHMVRAKQLESALHCNRENVYCSDPLVQRYKQRLLEAVAAAIGRMPNIDGRRDIAPSRVNVFHSNILACARNAEMACLKRANQVRDQYALLADFPADSVAGDACKPAVEKACTIELLSGRIDEWNKRNTEQDDNPVLALQDPGFDCLRGRRSAAMNTICRDADLSALHRDMVGQLNSVLAHANVREVPKDQAEILTDHYWHTATYRCDIDKQCIRAAIADRARAIGEIASELEVTAQQTAAREVELDAAQRLEDLASRREQLSGVMEGIVADATMPTASAVHAPENIRAYQRAIKIAGIEQELSELARREGRVYRGLWFWSQFRDPGSLRAVFRGNRTVPFTAESGAIYFHNGYPLERGHVDQMGILTAWVRVYSSMCSHRLPASADEFQIKTFTTSGPLINRTTRLSDIDVLRFQRGLMRPYLASRNELQRRQRAAAQENLWARAFEMMEGGLGAVSDEAHSQIGPYLYAQDDFIRFLDAVGCDSPTARQMSQGISLVAHGQSLPPETADAVISGAEWVSDTPQKPGEFRLHSEICWDYETASHTPCGCLVDIARERLGQSDVIPASVDYRVVHEAFMKAPAASQRICRDPLGAISAGLLSADR
ncbi:hypothetical protein [Kineobactrum salinum]|uniref:DUF1311 domain-containing protein n=1 Tax=Kineobactrum salinum TaxID=2708301 RepID=A0A6C0U053_9GAMM|nr:hypothetical protein [Kineobactrum salinum]QIB65411.1 hypothetical protein G3T16_08365 [Kineobactrum salinum]